MANLWNTFVSHADADPSALALVFGESQISFGELKALALSYAAALRALDLRREHVVALNLPKRSAAYALMLACLRLGVPYVFLDPRNPQGRSKAIIDRLKPLLLFTESELQNPHGRVLILPRGTDLHWPAKGDVGLDPVSDATGADPAYIMFTSGSTGEPKGAVIPQQGVLSLVSWAHKALGVGPAERFTAINPLHFDNSVFDTYCSLFNGATLVPIETSEVTNPAVWVKTVRARQATFMFAVPTLFLLLDQLGLLTPKALPQIRTFMFGGEGYPIGKLRDFHSRFPDEVRLVNVYGPTETSCICSSLFIAQANLTAADYEFPSLGHMHDDFSYMILDEDQHPLVTGEIGELWIGGPCVGLGYFANPAETANRFRQNPLQNDYRSILYRTGDLVRIDQEGLLWFRGRIDNQVKVRGHRIELEEIDLAVQAVSGINRAVAIVVSNADGGEIWVAYTAAFALNQDEMLAACRHRLPYYMQPSRMVQLSDLPTNANGKVDRRATSELLKGAE